MILLGDYMEYIREENRVYVKDNGKIVGEVTFPEQNSLLNINHTYVDPAYRGMHIADSLLQHAYEVIQSQEKTCIETCSYAKKWFQNHPEKQNIIKK